ncbi:MAG: thioredoxin [Evtepia sp.]|nr:thioredoxin [Evtepia sp.]MEE0748467.1 thioredoxin [Evtepia sp.]
MVLCPNHRLCPRFGVSYPQQNKQTLKGALNMAITTINQDNFEEKVTNAASPVLLDFWAAWCGPCTMLSPVVEELAQEHPEISFGKVNVDDVPELAQKYQISAIPTLLLFRDGKPVDMSIGVKSKEELEAFLK